MQKMSTLTLDGLVTAVYEMVQRETVMKPDSRLAQAVEVRIEPLSRSALQWLQGKGRASLLENGLILGATREVSLLLSLDEEEVFAPIGESYIKMSKTFLADERREGQGEVEFLCLTLRIYTSPDFMAKYNNRLSKTARDALEVARVYLCRESSQCVMA